MIRSRVSIHNNTGKILLGLLIFVPLALLNFIVKMPPMVSFILSGLAIIPLAAWISNSAL